MVAGGDPGCFFMVSGQEFFFVQGFVRRVDANATARLAAWPHLDIDVPAQGGDEFHQALDAEAGNPTARQVGDFGLVDLQHFSGLDLRHVALGDGARYLPRDEKLDAFLGRELKAQVREYVTCPKGNDALSLLILTVFHAGSPVSFGAEVPR